MSKNQGIYLTYGSDNVSIGVEKKINNQIVALSRYYSISRVVVKKKHVGFAGRIAWRMPFGSYGREYQDALNEIEAAGDISYIYIRDTAWDRDLLSFVRSIRQISDHIIIILELPTYPYANEYLAKPSTWSFLIKDMIYRRYTRGIADRIVTFSKDEYIFGVPTIRTMNGIVVDEIDYNTETEDVESINLIAVAIMHKQHGYERVIKGIHEYILNGGKRKVMFHLVGDGPQIKYYRELVEKYHLESVVKFYGNKTGEELEEIYRIGSVAIGSLGFHNIGATKTISSTLKTREYLAHGLPFISACQEDIFMDKENCPFYRRYPDDNSSIPIETVIELYDRLVESYGKTEMRKIIHKFAKENIDMDVVMKPIIDFIETERKKHE